MRLTIYFLLFATPMVMLFNSCDSAEYSSQESLSANIDSVSYSLGYFYGSGLAQEGVEELNDRNFVAGLKQALAQQDAAIDQAEMQSVLQAYSMELQAAASQRREAEATESIEEGQRFLQENADRDDVTVTESGLQYRVIEEGSGSSPSAESEVEVHYRGTLIDGTEFDSSYERDQTTTFPLNRVIPGWTEGLQLMQEGAKYEFFIPSDLAYGNNPPPGSPIKAGSTLIFEVELISVNN